MRKKKKHEKITLLPKPKLNSIEPLISNASTLSNASKEWLESFKKAHGILVYWISGEGEDVTLVIAKAWLERLPDIV